MRHLCCLAVLLGCVVCGARAGAAPATKNGGLAVSYVQPRDDFATTASDGMAYGLVFDYPLASLVGATGSVTWYRLGDVKMTEYAAGLQLDYGQWYLGAEASYTPTFKQWGLTPNLGIRRGLVDVSLRYQTEPSLKSWAVRLGFFF